MSQLPTVNNIRLYYGPIYLNNIWVHRPKRLRAVMENLASFGFNVQTEPMLIEDYLIVKLNNIRIFGCRFTLLKFSYDEDTDFILQQILWAAIEARARFSVRNKQ